MRTGAPAVIFAATAAALTLAACGSSSPSSTTHAALVGTTSSTSSTTTSSAAKPAKTHKHKSKAKTHKTTTTSTTSKTTKAKKTTSSTTTTTHTTTSKTTTTTAALKPPLVATLVGENHHPKIKTLWSYTITAKDSAGHPLSGTIETEFTYNGTIVGKENPFMHQFTGGTFTNQVTYPADSLGEPIAIQVIVITSIGKQTLTWSVKSVK